MQKKKETKGNRKRFLTLRDFNTFESIKRVWRKKHLYQEAFISFMGDTCMRFQKGLLE